MFGLSSNDYCSCLNFYLNRKDIIDLIRQNTFGMFPKRPTGWCFNVGSQGFPVNSVSLFSCSWKKGAGMQDSGPGQRSLPGHCSRGGNDAVEQCHVLKEAALFNCRRLLGRRGPMLRVGTQLSLIAHDLAYIYHQKHP